MNDERTTMSGGMKASTKPVRQPPTDRQKKHLARSGLSQDSSFCAGLSDRDGMATENAARRLVDIETGSDDTVAGAMESVADEIVSLRAELDTLDAQEKAVHNRLRMLRDTVLRQQKKTEARYKD